MLGLKIVRKGADYRWLRQQAKDQETLALLKEVEKAEKQVVKGGDLPTDTSEFSLHLGKYKLWFRKSDDWYALQIYTELFKERDHFLVEDFSGKHAHTVIDLGANQGFYTLKLKEHNPSCRVIALEPDPTIFHLLKKNIETNNVPHVELVNKAISGIDGEMDFQITIYAGVLGSKYLDTLKRSVRPWLKDSMIQKVKVEAVSLPTLMKEHKVDTVDILKMDIEDMEFEVLQAAESVLHKIKSIVMQWHRPQTRDLVIELLKKNGFAIIYTEPREYGDIYFMNSRYIRL